MLLTVALCLSFCSPNSVLRLIASEAVAPTQSFEWARQNVVGCQRMTAETMSFLGVLRRPAFTPPQVFRLSDRLQMSRVNAERSSAQVIHLHPPRNLPAGDRERQAMSVFDLSPNIKNAIASDRRRGPKPTAFALANLSPKTNQVRLSQNAFGGGHTFNITPRR